MASTDALLAIGVMTGNSLDGVDVVLSRFTADGVIEDILSHGTDLPTTLADKLRLIRSRINEHGGNVEKAVAVDPAEFRTVHDAYINEIAETIQQLLKKASSLATPISAAEIDLIGLHGQTCAHLPPSVAKSKDSAQVYTVQIGNGQQLADLTGITVVYDFRSDDLMNGGEGAPLAPLHHFHLADSARKSGHFPIAFCNAGNTGNITVISEFTDSRELALFGWDTGPFNNYPDRLMQAELGQQCDFGGAIGAKGKVHPTLLKLLFEKAIVTSDGANFLERKPPKSSDPQWYLLLPELVGQHPVDGAVLSLEDRVRTAEYFSAYIFVQSLSLLPPGVVLPSTYAVCGGGWKNPISRKAFSDLLSGEFSGNPLLPGHESFFHSLKANRSAVLNSEDVGFNGTAMEARIFADAAVCRVKGDPFTRPDTTGCKTPTVCGLLRYPSGKLENASKRLQEWLHRYNSINLTPDFADKDAQSWSRASASWQDKLAPSA